ncbi:MAG TPA: hypothetical protein P5567_09425 [Kiritimatiellia bacterium]|nr:hypothetical protein [Kiritimatiellia bacterium]HRZ12660.1 hypothetical protein [Kiritimatiellia bacterium]HSA19572.1 hypothetical protein [Kiritimatiellia bacterium]
MSVALPGKLDKRAAGLASALGLLAQTAPATVIDFVPDPEIDTDFLFTPLVSWAPTGPVTQAEAGNGGDLYPGSYSGAVYGCMGNLELSVGTPGGVEYMLSGTYIAPALAINDTVGPGHSQWSGSGSGWQASLDMSGVTWQSPFYVGYRIESGADYLYGYARLIADFDGGDNLTQIRLTRWAYEDTPNTGITIAAIPEPGLTMLLLIGVAGFLLRRFFRRRAE